jgi:hypothetical protein
MHIAVFTTHPLFQRHFATELERIQQHLNAGDRVTVLVCDAELLACETNNYHEPAQCALCIKSRDTGLALLDRKNTGDLTVRPFYAITADARQRLAQELHSVRTQFESIADMEAYTIEEFDLGKAALSSIISYVMDNNLDLVRHNDLVRRYILSGLMSYRSVQAFLDEASERGERVDRFYIFNGRMTNVRGVLRACESRKVEFFVHEAAAGDSTYSLFENRMPHDIAYMTRCIQEHWQNALQQRTEAERHALAEEWFVRRARGIKVNGYSFVEQQQQGLLPSDWNPHKRNIVIFNSADFEFIMVSEEYKHHIYQTQLDGIERIVRDLQPFAEYHLYLRIHPNLANVPNELAPLLALKAPNLTTLTPTDVVSTYAMMQEADKIVTFGSTVGIEAPFWDKPSILGGRAVYQQLGATYNPDSHEELTGLLLTEGLPPKDKLGSLMYGYFYNTFGIPFRHYQGENFFAGTFNGKAPFANRWLFRLNTLYKRVTPESIQDALNKRYAEHTLQRLTHEHNQH